MTWLEIFLGFGISPIQCSCFILAYEKKKLWRRKEYKEKYFLCFKNFIVTTGGSMSSIENFAISHNLSFLKDCIFLFTTSKSHAHFWGSFWISSASLQRGIWKWNLLWIFPLSFSLKIFSIIMKHKSIARVKKCLVLGPLSIDCAQTMDVEGHSSHIFNNTLSIVLEGAPSLESDHSQA